MGVVLQNFTIQDTISPAVQHQDIITPVINNPLKITPVFNNQNVNNVLSDKKHFVKKEFPVKHDSVTCGVIDPFEVATRNIKETKEANYCFYKNYFDKVNVIENREMDLFTVKTITPESVFINKSKTHRFEGKYDWIMGIVVFMIMLVAILRMYYGKILSQTFKSTINIQSARKLIAEKSSLIQKASVILSVIYFFAISLFLFECINFYKLSLFDLTGIKLYSICFISVLVFYFIKNLLYWFTGVFIDSESDVVELLSNFNIYYRILGIIILPIIFSIPYVPEYIPEILIYCGFAIIISVFIMRIIRGFVISFKVKLSLFYSFLYFCMLEILPMLYLFKAYKNMV